jgi:predicted dehydrogenase
MKRVGVAVVGLGVGVKHLQALAALPHQYALRAVCDIDAARAERVARDFGVQRWVRELDDLWDDPAIELVSLCTPPHLHLGQIRQCLQAGRDVLCEKPLVVSLDELDAVQAAQADSGRRVFPVFQVRWGRGFQQLRHLQHLGHARTVLVASAETHWQRGAAYYAAAWRGKWASESGGVCLTQAIHVHDLLTHALGPPVKVFAQLATRANPIEVEDCAAITLRLAGGGVVSLSATLGAASNSTRLRLVFDDLTVTAAADNPYRPGEGPWTFEARDSALQAAIDAAVASCPPEAESFTGQYASLYRTRVDGLPAAVTLHDARAALELVTAIYTSAETDQAVVLPLAIDAPRRSGWAPRAGGFGSRFSTCGAPGPAAR